MELVDIHAALTTAMALDEEVRVEMRGYLGARCGLVVEAEMSGRGGHCEIRDNVSSSNVPYRYVVGVSPA